MKLFLFLLLTSSCFAMSESQAYSISSMSSNMPSTIVSVAKTESNLIDDKIGVNGKDLGLMQIQVCTARFVSTKYKSLSFIGRMSDKQIRFLLLKNNYLNIKIGACYLDYLTCKYGYKHGISKYNGCKTDKYFNKVKENL